MPFEKIKKACSQEIFFLNFIITIIICISLIATKQYLLLGKKEKRSH